MAEVDTILFDFFGTLVDYERAWVGLGYPDTHAVVAAAGVELGYDEFLACWEAVLAEFEAKATIDHIEPSMTEVALAFGARVEPALTPAHCEALAATFGREWSAHIQPITGITEMIKRLHDNYRIGVVSNTGESTLVPVFLDRMGLSGTIDAVVLSVDHGYRKPHPSIYDRALSLLNADPTTTVFVGDSYDADYLGPTRAGLTAYLIDPAGTLPIPAEHRLTTVLEVEDRLA